MKVKLRDIAREAGVSIATVSRVLNNHSVSRKSRTRVEETIARLDYRPNLIARGLSKGKSYRIGVLVTNMENPYFASIMNAMEFRFRRDGYICNFAGSIARGAEEEDILRRFLDSGVDGLVIVEVARCQENSGLYTELNKIIPVVLINGNPERTDSNLIMMDQEWGMKKAMDYLIDLGHRDIAFIRGSASGLSFDGKERAFREKMAAIGSLVRDERILRLEDTDHFDTIDITDEALTGMLESNHRPTAVFACNELMGIGVLNAARRLGISVPGHLSLLAQDNTILSRISSPAITTVDMNPPILGTEAAEMMIQLLGTENPVPRRLTLYPELIVRESCAAPGGD